MAPDAAARATGPAALENRATLEPQKLHLLSASEAARWIRDGRVSSEELVRSCLARVEEAEPHTLAWAFLDGEYALAQARAADSWRLEGRPLGALHGVPVGLKDIIDTADMPTENGSVLHQGRMPGRDATVVSRLRAAGAVLLGKTVTAEFATFSPGKTKNPHAPEHTPGGSSSGSAAAVAASMVPLALGSQTNGSTIRPAAFCGVVGFKPTHGLISRRGMLALSRSLDHVGLFARSIEDVALSLFVLSGYDPEDPDTRPVAPESFLEVALREPALEPVFALIKTPHWEGASGEMRTALTDLALALGAGVEEVELPPSALEAWAFHRTIMEAEMAANLVTPWERGRAQLSESLAGQLARGRELTAFEYQRALAGAAAMYPAFAELFEQRYDAILTPAAPGAAPRGLASTGDPSFCTPWTLCGMPAISLPLFENEQGLPLGVQLVGARHADGRLLRTARWLARRLAAAGG